jgi:pimeloyl-ACP methyl ester carboxylesterase
VVIALHGHGSDRWQFIKDNRGECKGVRDAAAKFGLIVVSPDYRAKTSWMGPKAEADVVQIISEVKKRHHVNRVFIAGGSMGGTGALTFAVLHPELIAGVCSLNGTANLVEYDKFQVAISASFGGSTTEVPDEYKKRSAEFWPDKFTMPIALTTGGKDTTVPPQSVLRLAEKLKQAKRKVLSIHREEGGHSTTYEDTMAAMEFMLREAGLLTIEQRGAWVAKLSTSPVLKRSAAERERLNADICIFSAGVEHALSFDTSFSQADVRLIEKAVERDEQRAVSTSASWTKKKGKVARGFISAIDGSVQPYGVVIPKNYDGSKPTRLDVVLHGSSKPVGMSELKFISRFDEGDEDRGNAPDVDYIELHPLGRVEN